MHKPISADQFEKVKKDKEVKEEILDELDQIPILNLDDIDLTEED